MTLGTREREVLLSSRLRQTSRVKPLIVASGQGWASFPLPPEGGILVRVATYPYSGDLDSNRISLDSKALCLTLAISP